MAPRFIGKNPDSPNAGSPSVWDDGDSYVIQGRKIIDPDEIAALLCTAGQDAISGHETLIRFPERLMGFFAEAGG